MNMINRIKTTAGKKPYHWDYQEFLYLVHTLSKAKDFKMILNFFIDIHTPKEISEIIRRVLIASMLTEKALYSEIQERTGASPCTIAKIHQKFFRQKSVLADILAKAGAFDDFLKKHSRVDQRDRFAKMIDRAIYKRGGWLWMKDL